MGGIVADNSDVPIEVSGRSSHELDCESRFAVRYIGGSPITDANCMAATQYNISDPRDFSWANGDTRCALYNHYLQPNSQRLDCIGYDPQTAYTDTGWRTARSWHPGGVNLLLADGSVRNIADSVEPFVWLGLSTRKGGEWLTNGGL